MNAPIPRAGDSSVPSSRRMRCEALCVAKQYCGWPRRQARQLPQTARQLRITKSPGRDVGDALPDLLDDAGRLVPQQEREVLADAALAVVQVGVADAAGEDAHDGLPGAGVGDQDRDDLDRGALPAGDDSL